MMKKYWIAAAVVLCLSLLLTACGANGDSGGVAQTSAPSVSSSAEAAPEPEDRESENPKPEEPVKKADDPVDTQDGDIAEQAPAAEESSQEEQTAMKMNVQVGTYTFTATLEDNAAVQELVEMMRSEPVTIHMSDYSGFEKVGPLGRSLTTSSSQTTTAAGDIVLYNGNSIVVFYGSNSWSYTRIGKIDDLTDWTAALGSGDVTAIFTLAE